MRTKKSGLRVFSFVLALMMVFSSINVITAVAKEDSIGEITVCFQDFGIRVDGEEVDYPEQLGILVPETDVPIYEGDTIAMVTLRALDELGIGYSYTGTPESGFYLSQIKNFYSESLGTTVAEFGEFHSGYMSGWMISLNNWFINMGASEFQVEDGDIIRWQNTCQYGADIGCDWMNGSAEITGLKINPKYGTLSPEFDTNTEAYTLTVPSGMDTIKVEALQENYWSTLTYRVGDTYYKLLRDIPVSDGTQIVIESAFAEYAGSDPTDTDKVVITISKSASALDVAKTNAKSELDTYKNPADYREAQKIELASAIEAGKTAIDSSGTVEAVNTALANAKVAMDAIRTDSELGTTIKIGGKVIELVPGVQTYSVECSLTNLTFDVDTYQDANVYINSYYGTHYTFDTAPSMVRVMVQHGTTGASIYVFKLSDPVAELAAAKTNAKVALDSYKNPTDYREAQKIELAAAIEAGKTAIGNAETIEAVNTALTNAKTAIDLIKTDAELTVEENAALAQAKTNAKSELDSYKNMTDYREVQKVELVSAIGDAKTAIDNAVSVEEVNTALGNGKNAMDAIKTDAQLAEEEQNADSNFVKFINKIINFIVKVFRFITGQTGWVW